VTDDGADTAPLQPMMPPRRGWGIFGLGFYKDVAPTELEKSTVCELTQRKELPSLVFVNTNAKFVTCHCQSCSGGIEFERELFDSENPAVIECPHCGSQVRLYIPKTENAPRAQETLSSTPETQEKIKRGKRISLTPAQRETAAGKELLALLCEITRGGLISEEGVKQLNAWLEGKSNTEIPAINFLASVPDRVLVSSRWRKHLKFILQSNVCCRRKFEKVLGKSDRNLGCTRLSSRKPLKRNLNSFEIWVERRHLK
jgi:hypothetical protein